MALSRAVSLPERTSFARIPDIRPMPSLIQVQLSSFEWFRREGLKEIDDTCIRQASDKMEVDRVDEAIRSLPVQNKAILYAVSRFDGGTNTGELYLAYSSLCKKIGIETLTQRRLSGILGDLDLLGLVEASVVSKGRRGRTKKIQLLIDRDTLAKTLSEDSTFGF